MLLEDGKGSGRAAGVSRYHRAQTEAVTLSLVSYETLLFGSVWSLPFDAVDPTGADDYFVYVKNTDPNVDFIITRLNIQSTVAGYCELQKVTGTAAGGTAGVPVPRQVGSSKSPNLSYQYAVDITGLTSGGVLEFIGLVAATPRDVNLSDNFIVLQPGQAIALLWEPATGILSGNLTIAQRVSTLEV